MSAGVHAESEAMALAEKNFADSFERRFRAHLPDSERRNYDEYTRRFDRLVAGLSRAFAASDFGEMVVYANEAQSTMLDVLSERIVWNRWRRRFAERDPFMPVPT